MPIVTYAVRSGEPMEKVQRLKKLVESAHKKMESSDPKVNGFVQGAAAFIDPYAVVVAKPLWPRFYLVGVVLMLVAFVLAGFSWWLLPGVVLFGFGVVWTRLFWGWVFCLGVRKAGGPRLVRVDAEEAVEVVVRSARLTF